MLTARLHFRHDQGRGSPSEHFANSFWLRTLRSFAVLLRATCPFRNVQHSPGNSCESAIKGCTYAFLATLPLI
jgi:hypothetical protein